MNLMHHIFEVFCRLAGDNLRSKAAALVQTAEDAGKFEALKDKDVMLKSEFKDVPE